MSVLTSIEGQNDLPRYFAKSFAGLQALRVGRLDFKLADGRVFRIDGSEPGPHGVIEIVNPGVFARVLRDGELGFAEGYMDVWWKTPDLQAVLDVLMLNTDEVREDYPGIVFVRMFERFRHWLNSNSKSQARRNISAHYDLGNDFYAHWLDESMTYSSAMFQNQTESTEAAQARKYASICDIIGARDNHHVLEIGCGWGGFAEYAAKERGVRVTGLTISQAQHDFARERVFREGLAEKVDIVMRDYRDETARYDGVASIEMFEAVGEAYWPTYFDKVRDRLNPGAIAGLQVITVSDPIFETYQKSVDFIQKYIFPGGMLPSKAALATQTEMAGLEATQMLHFGDNYSTTLRRWYDDFNASWDKIEALGFDDRFRRMWNFYLASCASSFKARVTDVVQVGLRAKA